MNQPSQTPPPQPRPGFPLDRVLGRGGHGEVLRVQDTHTGRWLAVKILRGKRGLRADVQQRFFREMRVTSRLEHPHIVPVYEGGRFTDGAPYYMMQEIRGGNLSRYLQDLEPSERIPTVLSEGLDIFDKVCEGMEYAHAQGVIHRDLKPPNIALGDEGQVLIVDWGLARQLDEEDSGPSAQAVLGTPGYMPPEQANGEETDERSDIFGLGAILYEMITGEAPYTGPPQQRLVDTLLKPVPPLAEGRDDLEIDVELAAIIDKALARERDDRYPTVGHLRRDLFQYREGRAVSAHQGSWKRRLVKWYLRHRSSLAAGAGVVVAFVLLIGLVAGWNWYQREQQIGRYQREAGRLLRQVELGKTKLSTLIEGRTSSQLVATPSEEHSLALLAQAAHQLEQAHDLAPDREEIVQLLYQVHREMGLRGWYRKNYLLAQLSLEQAMSLSAKGEDALQALRNHLSELEKKRERKRNQEVATVEKIAATLARRPPRPGMFQEHLNRLIRLTSGPPITRTLLKVLDRNQTWPSRMALAALGKRGDTTTRYQRRDPVEWIVNTLERSVEKKREDLAHEAIWALGRLQDLRGFEPVQRARRTWGRDSIFWLRTSVPARWLRQVHEKGENR